MTNGFKGLDLIDRVSEGLWMEVCDVVPEAMMETTPRHSTKEASQTAEKRGGIEDRGEKERHTHLHAEC